MAKVDQMLSDESTDVPPLVAQSSSLYCALKVRHPSDIIKIFHPEDGYLSNEVPKTKFWTGSQADENLLAGGEYVLLEVKNRSSLIFKHKIRKPIENADNPKLLIPLHTAEHIGFSRLASVGPLVQKTANYTYTMEKVDSEDKCQGTTALHMNNEIFRLHTKMHNSGGGKEALAAPPSNSSWRQSFLGLFSLRMLFVMMLSRYGLCWANEKYNFLENDCLKLWLKNVYTTILDYTSHADEGRTWYDILLSSFWG